MPDNFPQIRILPVSDLLPHEWHDDQRALPLIERLRSSGVLRNPPMVTPLGDGSGRYMVLDGANRTTALQKMGIPHIIAQVVEADTDDVSLKTWNHVLWGWQPKALLDALGGKKGLILNEPEKELTLKQAWQAGSLAWIETPDQTAHILTAKTKTIEERVDALNTVVNCYKDHAQFDRTQTRSIAALDGVYNDLCALVVFPPFAFKDVLRLCGTRHLFPAGITRFTVSPRALRLNYSLDELSADKSLEEKNKTLEKWIQERMARKGVRYYAEPTVLFDE
jgi:hypothetical protein